MTGAGTRNAPRERYGAVRAQFPALPPRVRSGLSIEWLIVGLTGAAIIALGTISSEVLSLAKIHYVTSGGSFIEKLHPATYLTLLALILLLLRGGDLMGEVDRLLSNSKLLLVYFFACGLLVFQCVVLQRPFTSVVDTFVLPALLSMIIWSLTPQQRKPLVLCIHFILWLNIGLGFYEYFSKHRLIPMTLGKAVVVYDWRSSALLGHPLSAAGLVALYIMALIIRPRLRAPSLLGLGALVVAVASLMAFGGRTALVAVLTVLAGFALVHGVRLVRGERVEMPVVIVACCGLMVAAVAVPLLFGTGVFDNMITRFSSDKGSAHTRIRSLYLLSMLDTKELLLGSEPSRGGSLQSLAGLDYGIENFWISCIVQYGLIQTALITLGLACFFAEALRRSVRGTWITILFLCVVAASSVSFSSKTTSLAAYMSVIGLLLAREPARAATRARPPAAFRYAMPLLVSRR